VNLLLLGYTEIDSKNLRSTSLIGVLFLLFNLNQNPKLRSKHMNRVEVLDRVGGLLLLPNTEIATTKQVAEFYDVGYEAIATLVKRNKGELEGNSLKLINF